MYSDASPSAPLCRLIHPAMGTATPAEGQMRARVWIVLGLGATVSPACRDASSPNRTTPARDPGAVRVVVAAAGVDVPSQFSVTIDNRTTRAIGRNDSTTFVDLPTGSHTLALAGVGADCTLAES